MRSVGDIISTRMPQLGLHNVKQLAAVVEADDSHVSKYLNGTRAIPLERIARWREVLRLDGDAADEFTLAAHLAHFEPELREIIVRHEDDRLDARVRVAVYEDRIAILAKLVDALNAMRNRPPPPPAGPPPSPDRAS